MSMSKEPTEKVREVVHLPRELPNGWETATLAEVAEIVMGQSPSSDYYNTEGEGLPFFQGKAEFGDLYPEAVKWCSAPGKIAQKDDILMSVRAPVGPTNLAPSECCIGRGLAAIRPKHCIPSRYILHYLRSIERDVDSIGTGTTFKAISGKILREIPIPVAPLDQQAHIVAEIEKQFSRLDEAVANLKRVKANLKRYKAAVLKAAVEGKLTEEWRKAHPDAEPASKLLDRILAERRTKWEEAQLAKMEAKGKAPKNDKWKARYKVPKPHRAEDTYELPATWTWTTLGQLSWSVKDGPHYSPKYSESGVPFISGGNVRPEGIEFSTAKYITPELHAELSGRCNPEFGDLLYTKGGTTGIARINTEKREFNVWVHVAVLKLVDSLEPFYLQNALNSPHCHRQAQRYTHGVGNQDLGLTRMIWITVPMPPIDEQHLIVSEVDRHLSVIRETAAEVDATIQRAGRLRQTLLARAFSGRL
jgi:type I restriction enzyme S subunit